jgi:hypothetical protein
LIYLDTSVALAHLIGEDRSPPASLWEEPLVSSRLIEYETWNRIHSMGLTSSHGESLRLLLGRLALLELARPVVSRALEPFPFAVRTLDAIHLASIEFLRGQNQAVRLASYDRRMLDAADRMAIPVVDLP